jgi:DNA end-binding protein Ku
VSRKPVKKEIDMAGKLVQGLHTDFDPSDYKDEHRREVEKLIERKASGKQIEAPEEPEEEQSDDLMAALEASLA